MIELMQEGAYLVDGVRLIEDNADAPARLAALGKSGVTREQAAQGAMAYGILERHNTSGDMDALQLKFDALASHDITYVGIIQTARASGLERFPIPYVLTNCHNSLCAVGGTINEDDHQFGLSAAKRYGGIFVPAHEAVIHQYMREMMSGVGKMILGSDSHTRYGALGAMAVGEGGPELVKQLLGRTYDIQRPPVVAVYLTGAPHPGVGPQDVALAIIRAVFANGFVKNCVMEFVGDGIANLNVDYRIGIDVMTTETTCLTSVWAVDDQVKDYYALHGRPEAYADLAPADVAYYDRVVRVDLAAVEPMIALPFHPSNAYPIRELLDNLDDILAEVETRATAQLSAPGVEVRLRDKIRDGGLYVDQGIIAGCAGGTYDNLVDAADILRGASVGDDAFALSVYPASQPVMMALLQNGALADLMAAGSVIRTAFCGPCFGAGDVPGNGGLSIRHSTRNFPNREGSKPGEGQVATVALMDARSIAATAKNGGRLTPATDLSVSYTKPAYTFDASLYAKRCYHGFGQADPSVPLKFGPNITDWPRMSRLTDDLLLQVASLIEDPVTTTDELIPSGETSSYRSNPLRLAAFTLSRKDPAYVGAAKAVQAAETARLAGQRPEEAHAGVAAALAQAKALRPELDSLATGIGSLVYARKPGDGSAREQAASCQKVLGTWANIATEYATKRYRSNLINWGMLPFILEGQPPFGKGDFLFIPDIRRAVAEAWDAIPAYVLGDAPRALTLTLRDLTDDERRIILSGCLMNFYRDEAQA